MTTTDKEMTVTTETTQAPSALWCDNPEHAEAGSAVPAIYRVTWPDGRFRPALACKDCLEDSLSLYVLNGDPDGRRHPALIELAGASPVADELDELARLRNACKHMGSVIVSMSRQMECARIEMLQNGPERAMQWILNGLPDVDGNPPEMHWDGRESADEWFERTADFARSEASAAPVCRHCSKPVQPCTVRRSHAGCASGHGYIHVDGGHTCQQGSDGPYAMPLAEEPAP